MADYHTKFCIGVDTTAEQHDWLEQMHLSCANVDMSRLANSPQPALLEEEDLVIRHKILKETEAGEMVFDWKDDRTIVYAKEKGNVAYTASLFQAFLVRFDLSMSIGFEWAHTCTKMDEHGFGGGATVITKNVIRVQDTTEMLKALEALIPNQ